MAETYDVYFNDGGGMEQVASGISDTELVIVFGPFEYNTEYSWRVDATNEYGTTTGDVWTFTSIVYAPPLPTGVTLVGGVPTGTPTGGNNMMTTKRLVAAAYNKIWYENI